MSAFRNALFLLCAWLPASLWLGPTACAATFIDLATGKAADGSLIPVGQLDDQWTLVGAPAGVITGAARVISRNPSWFDANPDAQWISSQSASSGGTDLPAGDYVFRFTFNLASVSPDQSLSVEYGSDNTVVSATLNGNALTLDNPDAQFFTSSPWAGSFSTTSSSVFVTGVNTLEVTVNNWDPSPVGLAVRATLSTVAVPEPSSLLVLASACALGLASRLRTRETD